MRKRNKKDLDAYEDTLDARWDWDEPDEEIFRYLSQVYEHGKVRPIRVKGVEFIICTPEFSTLNQQVREKLEKLGVEFALHD